MIIAAEREETYEKVYKVWKDNTGREAFVHIVERK